MFFYGIAVKNILRTFILPLIINGSDMKMESNRGHIRNSEKKGKKLLWNLLE